MHIKHIIWSRKAVGCKCTKLLWVATQGRKPLVGTFSSDIISLICKLYITFCHFSLKKENKPQLQAFGIWVTPVLGGGERKAGITTMPLFSGGISLEKAWILVVINVNTEKQCAPKGTHEKAPETTLCLYMKENCFHWPFSLGGHRRGEVGVI